ncbi:MAG: PEP-CTERM sorting domain-containing protein, partial [Lysobacteraceae bacterium]
MKMHYRRVFGMTLASLIAILGTSQANAVAFTDTVQAPTGFFLPAGVDPFSAPYYRDAEQDWGWRHNPITTPFSTATLNISAFDVDSPFEIDTIYAYDNGVRTRIGNLTGQSDTYSFATFTLGATFFDDIASGLRVEVDIDAQDDGWILTPVKSAVSVDGGALPPPTPGAVPEPGTWAMFLGGFGLMGAAIRRRKQQAPTRRAAPAVSDGGWRRPSGRSHQGTSPRCPARAPRPESAAA